MKIRYFNRIKVWMVFTVLAFIALITSCAEEAVEPPVIIITVNEKILENEKDTIFLAEGDLIDYSFGIKASAKISEIYVVQYTAELIQSPQKPGQFILSDLIGNMTYPVGLTNSLEQEVKGKMFFKAPAFKTAGFVSLMIVVSDQNGNESRAKFIVRQK